MEKKKVFAWLVYSFFRILLVSVIILMVFDTFRDIFRRDGLPGVITMVIIGAVVAICIYSITRLYEWAANEISKDKEEDGE